MSIFLKDTETLVVKTEAVPGTAETLADADFNVRLRNIEIADLSIEFDDEASKFATGDHTHDEAVPGKDRCGFNFDVKITPPELTGDAPTYTGKFPVDKIFKSAGLLSTYDTTVGTYTYVPELAADLQTVTAAYYAKESEGADLVMIKGAGMMSELEIMAEGTSKPFMAKFALKGKVSEVSEVASGAEPVLSDTNLISTKALTSSNTTVIITEVDDDGAISDPLVTHTFCINAFSLKTGVGISEFECQSDNSGILYNGIVTRAPEMSIDPILDKISDFDFWGSIKNVQKYKVEIVKYYDVAKTSPAMKITVPVAQIMSPSLTETNGYMRNQMNLRFLRNIQGATNLIKQHDYEVVFYGTDID